MDWLIIYRNAEGREKRVTIRANHLPNHKTAARCIIEHEYGDNPPCPLGNKSAVTWLASCRLEILDIELLKDDRPGQVSFVRPTSKAAPSPASPADPSGPAVET